MVSIIAIYQVFISNSILIICLCIVEWFQVLLFNISDSIYQVFLSNLVLIIYLHIVKWCLSSIVVEMSLSWMIRVPIISSSLLSIIRLYFLFM